MDPLPSNKVFLFFFFFFDLCFFIGNCDWVSELVSSDWLIVLSFGFEAYGSWSYKYNIKYQLYFFTWSLVGIIIFANLTGFLWIGLYKEFGWWGIPIWYFLLNWEILNIRSPSPWSTSDEIEEKGGCLDNKFTQSLKYFLKLTFIQHLIINQFKNTK